MFSTVRGMTTGAWLSGAVIRFAETKLSPTTDVLSQRRQGRHLAGRVPLEI